jgi:hypothetical protein
VAAAALLATLTGATASAGAAEPSASVATVAAVTAWKTSHPDTALQRKVTAALERHRGDHQFVGAVLALQEKGRTRSW